MILKNVVNYVNKNMSTLIEQKVGKVYLQAVQRKKWLTYERWLDSQREPNL